MNPFTTDCSNLIHRGFSRIGKHMRLAFFSTVILGLLVHLFMFTNKLPNHDDIVCLFYNDATVTSGRWFLAALIAISSNFSLPSVNGILSLLYLGGTAALVCELFSIKRPLPVILSSFALVTFPSITNAFGFMFTADGYCLGFFLAALAAFLTDRRRLGFIPGAILLMLSLATYQATLCLFVAILAVRGLLILIHGELTDKQVWIRLIIYAGTAVVGILFYLLSSKIALAVTGLQMESYVGLDEMGKISLAQIPGMIFTAYYGFFEFAFLTSGIHLGLWLSVVHLLLGLTILFLLVILYRKLTPKTRAQRILYIAVSLLLPLLFNTAPFFGTSHIHAIMIIGMVMIYYLAIVLYETAVEKVGPLKGIALAGWACTILVFLSSFGWGIYANQCYLKLHLKYENSYALCNRIVNRIESSGLYSADREIAFVGEPSRGNYPQAKDGHLGSLGSDEGFGGPSEYSFIYDDRHFKDYIASYIGVVYPLVEGETLDTLYEDARVAAMPCYPAAGSLAVIDEILVVKVGPVDGE